MARQPGSRRLRRLRPGRRHVRTAAGAGPGGANEDSPGFLGGAFETIASCYADADVFVEAFRTGAGLGWAEHDHRLFSGVVRFFRPGYAAHLVGEWLPALDGVVEKLRSGASVADVGCGLGASAIIMAQAFDRSTFAGFDLHDVS